MRWLGHWCAERSSARRRCSGIRFAFAALFVGAFCERPRANAQRQSRSLSPQADLSSPLRSTHSVRITERAELSRCSFGPVDNVRKANLASLPKANVGRLSLQKILYILIKICYNSIGTIINREDSCYLGSAEILYIILMKPVE